MPLTRRRTLVSAAALAVPIRARTTTVDDHYAESVAMSAMSADTRRTLSVRLARFPTRGTGTLWLSAYVDDVRYAVVDDALELGSNDATPVAEARATFEASGASRARFDSSARHTPAMRATVLAESRMHTAEHPDPGPGELPATVRADFRVAHAPVYACARADSRSWAACGESTRLRKMTLRRSTAALSA